MIRKRVELPPPPSARWRDTKKVPWRQQLEATLEGMAAGVASREGGGEIATLKGLAIVATLLDDVTVRVVASSRELGHSWADIGKAMNMSKQAAQQRYGRVLGADVGNLRAEGGS